MDILMGLDNSRWLPRQANNADESPGNFRLMKSQFGKRYMIMGSDAEVREIGPIESPTRDALGRMWKGGMALTVWLMTGIWSALRCIILLPMKFVQARHGALKDPGCGVEEPRPRLPPLRIGLQPFGGPGWGLRSTTGPSSPSTSAKRGST
jgi:hypothetical protein